MVLVDSCVAKTVSSSCSCRSYLLFILQSINLSMLMELVQPVESCTGTTEGVAQEQERVAGLLEEQ